jgi:hypothetical protein
MPTALGTVSYSRECSWPAKRGWWYTGWLSRAQTSAKVMTRSTANSSVSGIICGWSLFELILKKQGMNSVGSGCDLMAGFCEHGSGLGFINVMNFLTIWVTVKFSRKTLHREVRWRFRGRAAGLLLDRIGPFQRERSLKNLARNIPWYCVVGNKRRQRLRAPVWIPVAGSTTSACVRSAFSLWLTHPSLPRQMLGLVYHSYT